MRRYLPEAILGFTGALVVGVLVLAFVQAPDFTGQPPHHPLEDLVPLAGLVGIIVGIVWMLRIYRDIDGDR